jgi:hypothetical protein
MISASAESSAALSANQNQYVSIGQGKSHFSVPFELVNSTYHFQVEASTKDQKKAWMMTRLRYCDYQWSMAKLDYNLVGKGKVPVSVPVFMPMYLTHDESKKGWGHVMMIDEVTKQFKANGDSHEELLKKVFDDVDDVYHHFTLVMNIQLRKVQSRDELVKWLTRMEMEVKANIELSLTSVFYKVGQDQSLTFEPDQCLTLEKFIEISTAVVTVTSMYDLKVKMIVFGA